MPGIGFNYGAPAKDALEVAQFLNNHLNQLIAADGAGRFIGLGTVPLQDTDLAIHEMKRCVLDLGLAGIQIGTSFDGQTLDSEKLESFWSVPIHPTILCLTDDLDRGGARLRNFRPSLGYV